MKIILGSQSIGRRSVLEKAGYEFDVVPANIDEKAIRSKDYEKLPLLIARAKTEKLLKEIGDDAVLITSDQVVVCNGELREKPENEEQAREYIMSYSNYPAQTNTAVVVTNTKNGKQAEGVDIAKVYFKHIPKKTIDELIYEGRVLSVAGGFTIENPLIQPYVIRIEGEMSSVTGLPLKLVEKLLEVVK